MVDVDVEEWKPCIVNTFWGNLQIEPNEEIIILAQSTLTHANNKYRRISNYINYAHLRFNCKKQTRKQRLLQLSIANQRRSTTELFLVCNK